MAQHMAEHIAEHMAEHIAEHMAEHIAEHTAEHIAEHMAEHIAEHGLSTTAAPSRGHEPAASSRAKSSATRARNSW